MSQSLFGKICGTLFIVLFAMIFSHSEAQTEPAASAVSISGVIKDKRSNKGIPHATLYIKELQSGVIANESGLFKLHLKPGTYALIVKSLSYKPLHTSLSIHEGENKSAEFALEPATYNIADVVVKRDKRAEDPAYAIMRKVMSRTPIYEKIVKSSVSHTYTKGSMKLEDLPFFLKNVKDEGVAMKEYIGKRFVVEGELETAYTSPNSYKYHTLAIRSSIPEKLTKSSAAAVPTINSMMSNIYGAYIGLGNNGSIPSPIRLNGLRLYSYKLKSATTEGQETIYHISYGSREDGTTKGELSISDKTWAPTHLTAYVSLAGTMRQTLNVTLNPIQDGLLLPTSYALNMYLNMLGIKMDFTLFSATSYKEVVLDGSIDKIKEARLSEEEKSMPDDAIFLPQKRGQKRKIEKSIAALEHKMDTLGLNVKDPYLIPEIKRTIKVSSDSLALQRDSLYWQEISTQPLSAEEKESYAKRDSLAKVFEKKRALAPKKEGERTGADPLDILFWGYDHISKNKKWVVGINGLLGMTLNNYRYTDGFWLGPTLFLRYNNRSKENPLRLDIKPSLYYTTHRKELYWRVESYLEYAGMRRGLLTLKAGHHSDDISGQQLGLLTNLNNAFFTLYDGRYTNMLYDRSYIRVQNKIDLFNGVKLSLGAEHRRSQQLPDKRIWGFVKPGQESFVNFMNAETHYPYPNYYSMEKHRSNTIDVALSFNTSPYYRVINGRKEVVNEINMDKILSDNFSIQQSEDSTKRVVTLSTGSSSAPVSASWTARNPLFFSLRYKQAIPSPGSNDSDFSFVSGYVKGLYHITRSYPILYEAEVGYYPHLKRMYADDRNYLKYENTSFVSPQDFLFHTMPPYTYAGKLYGKAQVSAPLPRILGNLFGKRKYLTQERLLLKSYWDKALPEKPFFEAGYNLSLLGGFNIGVYYGGYNFRENPGVSVRFIWSL